MIQATTSPSPVGRNLCGRLVLVLLALLAGCSGFEDKRVRELLHERGILFVPDFALNTGALVRGAMFHLEGQRVPVAQVGARVRTCVEAILEAALAEQRAPSVVGVQLADDRLAAGRA